MEIKAKAIINFSKKLGRFKERKLSKEFIRLRNIAIDMINPQLEHWNDSWKGAYDTQDYLDYISNKQQKLLDEVNQKFKESDIKLKSDSDADIVGYYKKDWTKITMNIQII